MLLEVELLGQRANRYAILLGILKFPSMGEGAFYILICNVFPHSFAKNMSSNFGKLNVFSN